MRTKSKGLLVLTLAMFAVALASSSVFSSDQKAIDGLLLAAFQSEKTSGSSAKVAEKFEAVLKADPNNYYALIKLGIIKTQNSQGATQDKKAMAEAVDYFLRASLSRPENPEAFLYLAELYYKFGYVAEGDRYARMAKQLSRYVVYDSVCLIGSRYEDTGNYYAAVLTYAPVALGAGSKFRFDPYLINRLYQAALFAPAPYDWVYPVFNQVAGGEERSQKVLDVLRNALNQALARFPQMVQKDYVEIVVKMILREILLADLRKSISPGANLPARYEMPTSLYKHFFCNAEEIPPRPFTDPYEAFVKASFESVQEQARVLSELRGLRDEALKAIADEKNDVDKAKKLFQWLKKRALVDYNALDGYSAKGVVEDKKFLCLSGAIVYTLMARDAKLNVCGVLEPGHAYASLAGDRKIRIETTTEGPEGFDYKPEEVKSREKDRVLQLGPFATYGDINDPMKFVAYQFSNAAVLSVMDLVLNKNEKLLRQVLKQVAHVDEAKQADVISAWRTYGIIGGRENMIFWRLVRKMAADDDIFRMDLIQQMDKNVEFLKTARGLSPFDVVYKDLIREYIMEAADFESLPAQVAEEEREQKLIKLMAKKRSADRSMIVASAGLKTPKKAGEEETVDAASISAELEQLEQEAKENWEGEKKFWMKRVKRLANAAKKFPCDEKLQNNLAQVSNKVRVLAETRGDAAISEELRPVEGTLQR
jgi:hypothetical protein